MTWPNEIGRRFANWLNRYLSAQLPVGDVEARQWKKNCLPTKMDSFSSFVNCAGSWMRLIAFRVKTVIRLRQGGGTHGECSLLL